MPSKKDRLTPIHPPNFRAHQLGPKAAAALGDRCHACGCLIAVGTLGGARGHVDGGDRPGLVLGLLCVSCARCASYAGRDVGRLRLVIDYLERTGIAKFLGAEQPWHVAEPEAVRVRADKKRPKV